MKAFQFACIIFFAIVFAYPFSEREPPLVPQEKAAVDISSTEQAKLDGASAEDHSSDSAPAKPDLTYLAYYVYSEVPPDTKPADTVLDSLKDISPGTSIEEINRALT